MEWCQTCLISFTPFQPLHSIPAITLHSSHYTPFQPLHSIPAIIMSHSPLSSLHCCKYTLINKWMFYIQNSAIILLLVKSKSEHTQYILSVVLGGIALGVLLVQYSASPCTVLHLQREPLGREGNVTSYNVI